MVCQVYQGRVFDIFSSLGARVVLNFPLIRRTIRRARFIGYAGVMDARVALEFSFFAILYIMTRDREE